MDTMGCMQATSIFPMVLFCAGVMAMTILVKSNEKLSLMEAIYAMIRTRFRRNLLINVVNAATVIIPFALWIYLLDGCNASLT